jgi:23S rRNA G2069 N7-methylase RlmK/C1962 C5-methylase RlmI
MVTSACGVLAPGGLLWLASNTRGFSLSGAAHAGVVAAGRRAAVVAEGGLPVDYPTELADAGARYLQTLLLRVDA